MLFRSKPQTPNPIVNFWRTKFDNINSMAFKTLRLTAALLVVVAMVNPTSSSPHTKVHFSETFSDIAINTATLPDRLSTVGHRRSVTLAGVTNAYVRLVGDGIVHLAVTDAANAVSRLSCIGSVESSTCDLWQDGSDLTDSSNIKNIELEVIPSSAGEVDVSIRSIEIVEAATKKNSKVNAHDQDRHYDIVQLGRQEIKINWDFEDYNYAWDDADNKYQFSDTLGKGHFGTVFRGINRMTGQEVAIKEILKRDCNSTKYRELTEKELKILKVLPDHPNICKFLEHFDSRESVVII